MASYVEAKEAFLKTMDTDQETALRKHGDLLAFGLDWWLNQRTDTYVELDRESINEYRKRWTDLAMSSIDLDNADKQIALEDPDLHTRFEQLRTSANVWIAGQMLARLKKYNKRIPMELVDFLTEQGRQDL